MLQEFRKHIELRFPELISAPFILACSGGLDSTVLAHLCSKSKLSFSLAHCNFNLRGDESDRDELFVKDLASLLNVKLHVNSFNTKDYANLNKVSIQMAARTLRYAWFADLLKLKAREFVVTAHHADDNLETFIINLSRGTGIDGLCGIPERNEHVLRPILPFSRSEILSYAQANAIEWREDASNDDTKYLRNKIRHQLLPVLKELHPTFDKNFTKTQHYLRGTAALLDQHITTLKATLFIEQQGVVSISLKAIQQLDPIKPYLYDLFKDYGFTEWDDVFELLTASSGKTLFSSSHRLIKDREQLLLQKISDKPDNKVEFFLDKGSDLPLKLQISPVENITDTGKAILYVDKETLKQRLSVRKWRNGDYFYPLGMKGKKKISKFFKDEKMDLLAKEDQWLLCCGKDIIWVIGRRADERFKVKPTTKSILKVTWENSK